MTKTSQIALRGIPPERSTLAGATLLPRNRTRELRRMAAGWRAALDWIAPMGYEDEAGFHYGAMPNQKPSH